MRVLIVSDSYPPATGGLEQAVQALAYGLTRAGDTVKVATFGGPGTPASADEGGVRVHRVEGWTRHLRRFATDTEHMFHPTAPDPQLVGKLQILVDRFQPDIVHAHGWILHSCLLLRLPVDSALVLTLHDYSLTCAKKTLIRKDRLDTVCPGPALHRCLPCSRDAYGTGKGSALVLGLAASTPLLDRVDMFLPISTAVASSLPPIAPGRTRTIASFVPDDIFDEARSVPTPNYLPAKGFLVFVGARGAHKGIDILLQAHAKMCRAMPLVVISPTHPVEPRVPRIPTRPVIDATGLTHGQIMASLSAATLAIVPSRWAEPQGLVAIEAMAAGLPVVACDVGGLRDLVTTETGVLVPPGDPNRLATAMDQLVADRELCRRMGDAGASRAHRYTESAVLPQVRQAYVDAIVNRRERPRRSKAQRP